MKTRLSFAMWAVLMASSVSSVADPAPPRWGSGLLQQKPAWYASETARAAADNVLRYQSRHGGWPKNTDLLAPATSATLAEIEKSGKADTIDNSATTIPIRFVALVTNATGAEKYRDAVIRGLDSR